MQHSSYHAIWFDLDGTLFDTAEDIIQAVNQALADAHYPQVDGHILKRYINFGAKNLIARAAGHEADDPAMQPLMARYAHHYLQALSVNSKWYPGMEELICAIEAQRIPWGIITNKAEQFTIPLIAELGLSERIAALVCGDTTTEAKPSAKPLHYACTRSGHDPRKCLFVGDNSTDIMAGKAAGMTTVACAYGYTPPEEDAAQWGADHVIHHPQDLHAIIWTSI